MLTLVIFIGIVMLSFINAFHILITKHGSQLLKKFGYSQNLIDTDIKIRNIGASITKSICYLIILVSLFYKLVPQYDRSLAVGIAAPICYFVYCLLIVFFAFLDVTGRYYGDFCKNMSDTTEILLNRAVAYLIMLLVSFLLETVLNF